MVVGGDGFAYVVMFHCHGTSQHTPTKTEADTSFQCLGGGGLGFFFRLSLSLENLEQQNSSVFLGSIIMESCFREKARFPKFRLSTKLV